MKAVVLSRHWTSDNRLTMLKIIYWFKNKEKHMEALLDARKKGALK
jgi:hypothetical protein